MDGAGWTSLAGLDAAALRRRLEALCDAIEAREPHLQALVPGTFDRARILRDADTLCAKYPDPDKRPPLFAWPVGVKDIFRADGFPTRCGTALPHDLFDGAEASSVTRLKAAGAIAVGKTVTTEFAFSEPGPTRNLHNPEHTPGGSSSGSAAGVAAEFFPAALGTQTVGSVIRPAAFCGVVGFKPSFGRVPADGVIPYSISADHVGVLCAVAKGLLEPLLAALCDGWNAQAASAPQRALNLGVPEGPYLARLEPNARAPFDAAVEVLARAGHRIVRVQSMADFDALEQRHTRLIGAELARYHAPWFARHRDAYRPQTRARIELGQSVSDTELAELRKMQQDFRMRIEKLMADAKLDAWVCPSATGTAPRGLGFTGDPAMNLPWTHAGLPVLGLPAGRASGLPLGMQFAARFSADEALAAQAPHLEGALRTCRSN
ncbi:MAG: amidase [Planctomycetes bacterium]|nr:amidase [Planctomycetota bacterium]